MSGDVSGFDGQQTLSSSKVEVNKNENRNEEKKTKPSVYDTFPWLNVFHKWCRNAVGSKKIKGLEDLLSFFVGKVAVSIQDCYKKTKRAAKLRTIVNETLVYFNMFYQEVKFEFESLDEQHYLNQMTLLMSMYLDLEIKASNLNNDSLKKIAQLMTSSLYVFLDHSEDHIAEAILRAKLITKANEELCAPVLSKFLKECKCFVKNEGTYVKYLLAFKLWRKITSKTAPRDNIVKNAVRKLGPPPHLINNIKRIDFLPVQEFNNNNITSFYMNAKFDFINAKLEFLKKYSVIDTSPRNLSEKSFAFSEFWTDLMPCLSDKNAKERRFKKDSFVDNSWSDSQRETDADDEEDDDDTSDVEFIEETSKKISKPVVITIESDEETDSMGYPCKDKKENDLMPCKENLIQKIKTDLTEDKDCYLNGKHRLLCALAKPSKNVPEDKLENSLKTGENVCSSTKQSENIVLRLQSPAHGIADSTSNHIGSPTGDCNFQSPKHQVYEIHSNTSWDDIKSEVASSSESIELSSLYPRRSSSDSSTKSGEISSTRQNSVPSSCSVDSINLLNLPNKSFNSELPTSNGKIRIRSPKELRYKSSRTISGSDNTVSNSSVDSSSKSFSPIAKSVTFEDKTDTDSNLSEKENLTVQNSLSISSSRPDKNHFSAPNVKPDSAHNSKPEYQATDKIDHKIKTCDNNLELNKSGESLHYSKQNVESSTKSKTKLQSITDFKYHKTKDQRTNDKIGAQKSQSSSQGQPVATKKTHSNQSIKHVSTANQYKDSDYETSSKEITKKVFQVKQLQRSEVTHPSDRPEGKQKDLGRSLESVDRKQSHAILNSHGMEQPLECSKKFEFNNVKYKIVKSNALKDGPTCENKITNGPVNSNGITDQSKFNKVPVSDDKGKRISEKVSDVLYTTEHSRRKKGENSNLKTSEKKLKTNQVVLQSNHQPETNPLVDEFPVPEVGKEELVCDESEFITDKNSSPLRESQTGKSNTDGGDPKNHVHQNSVRRGAIILKIYGNETSKSTPRDAISDHRNKISSAKSSRESNRSKKQRTSKKDSTKHHRTQERVRRIEKSPSPPKLQPFFSIPVENSKGRYSKSNGEKEFKNICDQTFGDRNNENVQVSIGPVLPKLNRDPRLRGKNNDLIYSKTNRTNSINTGGKDSNSMYFPPPCSQSNISHPVYYPEHADSSSSKVFMGSEVRSSLDLFHPPRCHLNYEQRIPGQDCDGNPIAGTYSEPNIPVHPTPSFSNLDNTEAYRLANEAFARKLQEERTKLDLNPRDRDNGLLVSFDPEHCVSKDVGCKGLPGVHRDCVIGEMKYSEHPEIEEDLKDLSAPWEVPECLLDDQISDLTYEDLYQYLQGVLPATDMNVEGLKPYDPDNEVFPHSIDPTIAGFKLKQQYILDREILKANQELSEPFFEEPSDGFVSETEPSQYSRIPHPDASFDELKSQEEGGELPDDNPSPTKTPRVNNTRVYTSAFCPLTLEEAQNLDKGPASSDEPKKCPSKMVAGKKRATVEPGPPAKNRKTEEAIPRRCSERLQIRELHNQGIIGIPSEFDVEHTTKSRLSDL